MKLTNQKALTLFAAHQGLDAGRERVVKDGDREKIVSEPFDFTPDFYFAMSVNLNRLTEAIKPYNKANNMLVTKHSKGGVIDPAKDQAGFLAYNDEHDTLLEQEIEVDLTPLKREELNLAKNKIPMRVIAGLLDIMPGEKGPSAGNS